VEGTGGSAGYLNGMVDESIFDDGLNADVEDVDELDGEDASFLADVTDVRLCEVEVQGNVREVQGDEEGLVTTDPLGYVPNGDSGIGPATAHPATYYGNNGTAPFPLSSSPEPASYNSDASPAVQWMMARSAPSPAFSSASMPSPQSRMSSVAPSAPYSSMGEYMTCLSAPSHKATFDHAAIYAHHHTMSPGPGPVRRHRSVTPSLVRYGESIRRPYSAAMSDIPAAASRSYHPYAVAASSSHSGSAQSSPGSYNVPLDYGSTMSGHIPIPLSRSESGHGSRPGSSHLQDQMSQMLTLDSVDGEHHMGYGSEPGTHGYAGLYRTDSPASYAHTTGNYSGSPATRATMLDANAMYTMHGQSHYGGHDGQFYNHGHAQSVPM
jgi:transcription factor STE12